MCGIFGVMVSPGCETHPEKLASILKSLFLLSESRGKEASGIALNDNGTVRMLKSGLPASKLVVSDEYLNVLTPLINRDAIEIKTPITIIGHSRLMTNGKNSLNANNQPVNRDGLVAVHNGIIVNDDAIWGGLGSSGKPELDTEAFVALVAAYEAIGEARDVAVGHAFQAVEGNASVLLTAPGGQSDLCAATNNGSLYGWFNEALGLLVFASERYILTQVLLQYVPDKEAAVNIFHVRPGSGICVSAIDLDIKRFEWPAGIVSVSKVPPAVVFQQNVDVIDYSRRDYPDPDSIKRCTRCVLPETFPHIKFDEEGVCNLCLKHEKAKHKSLDILMAQIEPYRSVDGSADCLVGLSGGRDSCFGLHVVKNVLKMNPIAYTYDWGLVTDSARRNISRMCGKLGVEHILISADIPKKRSNVRKNIQAWLKRPSLCMIPIFMAGDKQFYYYAHKLRQQTGVKLFMFGAGNVLERTDFKTGFCGLKGNSGQGVLTQLSKISKFRLAACYALEFLRNPRYINSSLMDSLWAFYSSYILTDDYFYLYHYYPWIEQEVEETLRQEYGWEGASDTSTTWRVGDGTAAFYNYIYYVVAGFTEHDTFRSNQIREGMMSREEAMERVKSDNKPRWESLEHYAKTIGFNLDEALLTIHGMPKLYK